MWGYVGKVFDHQFDAISHIFNSRHTPSSLSDHVKIFETDLITCFLRKNGGPACAFFPIFKDINSERNTLFLQLNPKGVLKCLEILQKNKPRQAASLSELAAKKLTAQHKIEYSKYLPHPRDFLVDFSQWEQPFPKPIFYGCLPNDPSDTSITPHLSDVGPLERYQYLKETDWKFSEFPNSCTII